MRVLICAACGYQCDDPGEGAKGIFELDCDVCGANMVQLMREDYEGPQELAAHPDKMPWW